MKFQRATTTLILPVLCLFSLLLAGAVAGAAWPSFPGPDSSIPGDNFDTATNFFTINDGTKIRHIKLSPFDWFDQYRQEILDDNASLPLLSWTNHDSAPELPVQAYNRKKQFGTWIVDSSLGGCYNTRARVLMRDSQTPVTYSARNKCVVESGRWLDPYTGQIFSSASDLQIDHVVPLKHAYFSGAWQWSKQKRCLYTNFISDNFHLRSVSGHENMKKGDMSPSGYLPPDSHDVCSYVTDWLKIKMTWNLIMAPTEADAIQKTIAEYHCDPQDLRITTSDLRLIREKILALQDTCKSPKDDNGGNDDPHNSF
jgi:hypothetical protein